LFLFLYRTDLGTILNRLGEKIDHTSCPPRNQINICRDYTGNVHNILRSSLQAFRRQRFNPEARLDVVFVDSEQTSEGAVDGGGGEAPPERALESGSSEALGWWMAWLIIPLHSELSICNTIKTY
jgi:hypothetical protein